MKLLVLLRMLVCALVAAHLGACAAIAQPPLPESPDLFRLPPPPPAAEPAQQPGIAPRLDNAPRTPSQPAEQLRIPNPIWWQPIVTRPLQFAERSLPLTLDQAVLATLQQSPQVKSLSSRALARQFAIDEAAAKFDVRSFVNNRLTSNNDAVGNTLTTGGAQRFIDSNWYGTAGLRKLQSDGGEWELSQRLGWQDTNSIYFVPANQGTAKMSLTYTRPLMRGAGCDYQTSVIVLAELDSAISNEQLNRELQTLLIEVHRQYWDLYFQRAVFVQRHRFHGEARDILNELLARRGVDVLESQIVRARAAVSRRETAMIRHTANARNAESRLRAIIGDVGLTTDRFTEIIPDQPASDPYASRDLNYLLARALEHRPEIHQSLKEVNAAAVRANVAENEIKPVLNLVLGSYVNGLQGNSNIPASFGDQFSTGRPSAWVGVEFESPWGNRAARARYQGRQTELRQMSFQLEAVTAQVRAEVEIAERELVALSRELDSRFRAMQALRAEINYLFNRWRLLPGEGQDAGVLLDDILSAQERLADAEQAFVGTQVEMGMAQVQLLRATGELLEKQNIEPVAVARDGRPVYLLERPNKVVDRFQPPPEVAAPQRPSTTAVPVAPPTRR